MKFYITKFINQSFHRNIIDAYMSEINGTDKSILDIGSKNRRYDNHFKSQVVAIDLKPNKKFEVRSGDITKLRFKNCKFDLVICAEVLEYVDDYKKGISEVARVLKSDGKAVFTIPFMYRFHQDRVRLSHFYLKEILKPHFSKINIIRFGNGVGIFFDILRFYLIHLKPAPFRYIAYIPYLIVAPLVYYWVKGHPSDKFISGYFLICDK